MTTDPTEPDPARSAVEAQVRAYCGWVVAPEETIELTLDGPGTGALILPSLYVAEIISVVEDDTELEEDVDFSWSQAGILRRTCSSGWWAIDRQPCWSSRYRSIVVEFTHGYADWPLEVAALMDRLQARSVEGSSLLVQVGGVQYATDRDGAPLSGSMTASESALLDPYRLPSRV